MLGDIKKTTKSNLLKGIPWRFGLHWPGKRCEAKTKKGTPCQRPAKLPVGRCSFRPSKPISLLLSAHAQNFL